MKSFLSKVVSACAVFLIICSVFSAETDAEITQLLLNEGFEDSAWPPVNWSEWQGSSTGNPADGVAGWIDTAKSHSGAQCAVRELYGNGIRWGGYTQDADVEAGEVITASGWVMNTRSEIALFKAETYIELKFLDASLNEIATHKSAVVTKPTSWKQLAITQTAPANTAVARFSFILYALENKSAGRVYFDDARLEVDRTIPDTTPPVVIITSPADGTSTESSPINVTGTVDDPTVSTIDVNGKTEPVVGGGWSSDVFLDEGANLITATATDAANNSGSDSITVTYSAPNLVLNVGFEDSLWPPVNWSEWSGAGSGLPEDGVAGYISDVAYSGTQSAGRTLYGAGSRWGGYSQDIAVGSWDFVRASCQIMSPATDPLANGAEAYIEIKFFDSADEELGYYKSSSLTAASSWTEHNIQRCAPSNATKVRLSLVLVGNLDNSTGTVYFDEVNLSLIPGSCAPEPGEPFNKPQSTGSVQVSGTGLLVGGQPFTVKGACYQPSPVGSFPWEHDIYGDPDIYNRDLPVLRAMGVNAIRTYTQISSQAFLDACYNGGIEPIYVVMGFYIESQSDLGDAVVRSTIKTDFQDYVNTYKGHPAVLMWSPGNETEYAYEGCDYEYFTLINELAEIAYLQEGSAYHPVTAVTADIVSIGDGDLLATDDDMDYLDVWGANVYRGYTFGDLFTDYPAKSGKPFWVSEFGVDAWHTNDINGDPAIGYIDEISQEQWAVALWDEMAAQSAVCFGGMVFEYSDEWWKSTSGDKASHDYAGWPYPLSQNHPDHYSNEEWYGIVSVSDNGSGADLISERSVYYGLQSRWVSQGEPAMSVNDITLSLNKKGPNTEAQAVVTVLDENTQPVANAIVYATWSGLASDSDAVLTDSSGQALIISDKKKGVKSGQQFTITVTDITANGYAYDPASNVETSDTIIVP